MKQLTNRTWMILGLGAVVLTLVIVTFFDEMKVEAKSAAYGKLTANMFVDIDQDNFDKGLPIGASLPSIRALYQGQEISDLLQFSGSKGLVILASRSLDWCPYCMHQAAQIGTVADDFTAAGLGLVMITYDTPNQQRAFIKQHNISYAVISDIEAFTMNALGILREDYPKHHKHYGLPYPGSFTVTPDGKIVGKWFLEGYSTRIGATNLLEQSLQALL